MGTRIGEILVGCGYVTDEQLQEALAYQESHEGIRLGRALIEMGFLSEWQMLKGLGLRLGLKTIKLPQITVDSEAAALLPEETARRYQMLPVKVAPGILTVLTNDPLNFYGLEDIRQITGLDLEIYLCELQPLMEEIRHCYSEIGARRAAFAANQSQGWNEEGGEILAAAGDDDTPVINLLNQLLEYAYRNNVSDIHIEPFSEETRIRMRIDGEMAEFVTLQKGLHMPFIARIKILGNMDIAEHRIPQDGHFQIEIDRDIVNTRVSTLPTVFGEKAVIRLLSGHISIDHEDTFGMAPDDYQRLCRLLKAPNGLIYITGPTGSGKTTTLYMALKELSRRPVNICTIEDPVEKKLPGISQCQVNDSVGVNFERGLRAILRQDPDIIMVGETRDTETARISVRSAITGHLVLSTLHTNDAVSAIVRLEDMGVEPYLTANALVGVVAQRLMKKLCRECARTVEAGEEERRILGKGPVKIRVPGACPLCRGTGYRGRVAIHEILIMDRRVQAMIASHTAIDQIREYAVREQGMRTLRESGTALVCEGVTSIEELKKVIYYDESET